MESEYEYDDLGSGFDGSSSSSMNPHLGTVSNVNGRNPYDTSGSLQLAPIYSNPIHQRESIGDILNRYQGRPSSSDHRDFYENNYEENVESHFGFDNRGAHVGVCMSRTHQTPFGNARKDVGMQMSVGYGGLAIRTSSRTSISGDGHGRFHTIGFPGGSLYRSPFGDPMFQPMGSMLSPFGGLFSPFGGMFALPSGSHSPCHDSSPFGFVRQNSPSQNQDMSTGSEGPIIEEIFDEEENDRSCLTYETTAGSHLAIEETTEDRYSSLGLGLLPDTETNYAISSEENQVIGDGNSEHTSGGILNDSAYSEALTSAKNITGLKADIDSDKGESDKSRNPNAPRFREGQAVAANSFGSSQENDQQRPSIIHKPPEEIQTSVEYTNSGDNSRIVLAGTKDKPKFTKRTFKNIHFQLKDDDASLPFLRPSFEESKRIDINQPDDQLTVELDVNETLKLNENSEQRKAKRESTNKNTFLRRRNDSVCSSSSEQDRNIDIESFESLKTSTPQQSKSTKEVHIDTLSTAFDTVTIDEHISDEPHTCKTTTLKEHDGPLFSSSSAKNQSISFEPNQCSDEAYVESPDEMCENLDVYSKDSMAIHLGCIEEKIHKDTCSSNEARYTEDDIKRHADNISQCTYKITDGTKEDVFEKSHIDTSDVLTETEKRKNENWKDDSNEQEERDGGKVSLQQTSVPFSPDMEISNSNNLYENKDNEENSRPDNTHEDTASNINNDRNQTKQGLTKTSDPSTRSLMASEVANAPTPSANHSESKVSPFPAEMDNALGTDRLHVLLIISTDDSQRRLDRPITTFMSKESRKIEAGNRFNIISYEAEGQMQNKSMQPNISEKTENDSSYRHNTFQIRTEPDRPNDIFKDSAHDEIDPNADTMEREDYFSEKKTRPGQNQDKTTTKNDEGEISTCHAIQQFQSEPNLKKQTETDGLPSTLNTGGHSFENTENVPPSDKKHKASPQIIQSRENTSQRIMPSDEKYCRGIEWQYPDQVSQSNKQSHRNNRSAHKVSYSHATDKADNSVGHRDHTCMCQSKCKHLHIQKNPETCICGHTHVCYDCNKRFTAKDYDRFKQDAGEDEIFDHPGWKHLKEYGNKHSQFTDPKPKPTKTIVNKNTVARSTGTVSTASQEKQTGSSKVVQETRPSNYSNPTNDLNDLVGSVGLVMKDVFPDGNCLFTSICDQLRIRGDFSYTPRKLRHAAVDFLREHPHQEDGTPLLAFLTDDERDWDKYLNSMSRDGHWGDHFVIWALAHVLDKRIVIYRGHAELQKTIVEPTGPIKSAGRFGRMTSPDDLASGNNSEEGKEEVPYVEHPVQPSHNVEELYLGHISQSHYVSLRPNDWHQRLMEVLKNKQTSCLVGSNPKSRQMDSNADVSVGKEVPIFSSDDLNYFLNYLRRGGLLINCELKRAHYKNGSVTHFKKMKRKCDESERMTNYLIGDIGYQFLSKKQTQREMDQCNSYYYLTTPKDTTVVKDVREGSKKDLIIQNESCKVGQCKLTPVTPHLWKPNLKIIGSLAFLSHIEYKSTSPSVKNCMFVALKCASWPEHAMEWKNRSRPNDWPSQSTIEEIIEKGVRIIPAKNKTIIDKGLHSKTSLGKITENGDNPDIDGRSEGEHNSLAEVREFGPEKEQWNLIWEYNFDISESILCEREFSREAKMLHCILEAVSSFVFEGRDMLTRRHLKALAFFTCERFSTEDIRQRPGKCLLFEISLLTDYLQRKHFPHYFMRGRNLVADMEYRDIVWHIERLQVLKIHLMPILYFVLDFCTLRNVYDVGNIFDDLVEAVDKRRMESKTQAMYMLPLCVAAITNCAKSKQFEELETQIDIWFNELTNTYGRIMISKQQFVHEILFHMPLQEQWLFAFYLECTKGSEFIQFVCKGKSSVQFENLFGDQAVSVLCEDTSLRYEEIPVPTAFLGDSMIGFALRLSDVLEIDICSSKAFEAAIHYFLKANTHDLLLSIEKDQNDYEDYYSHSKISDLRRLFQYLYNSYEKKDARLFYDMMDLYDELCNFVATASEFEVLAGLWTYFGDYEKAREAQMKAVSVREEAFSTF